jgi:secreted protein, putative
MLTTRSSNLLKFFVNQICCKQNFKTPANHKWRPIPLSSVPQNIHIIDDNLINFLVKNISDDLPNEDALIIEVNPGPGFLTEALLKANVPRLRCFSSSDTYDSQLEVI